LRVKRPEEQVWIAGLPRWDGSVPPQTFRCQLLVCGPSVGSGANFRISGDDSYLFESSICLTVVAGDRMVLVRHYFGGWWLVFFFFYIVFR